MTLLVLSYHQQTFFNSGEATKKHITINLLFNSNQKFLRGKLALLDYYKFFIVFKQLKFTAFLYIDIIVIFYGLKPVFSSQI